MNRPVRKPAPAINPEAASNNHQDVTQTVAQAMQIYFGAIRECELLRGINAGLGQEIAMLKDQLKTLTAVNDELRAGTKVLLDAIDAKTAIIARVNAQLLNLHRTGKDLTEDANAVAQQSSDELARLAALAREPERELPRWIAGPDMQPAMEPAPAAPGLPDISELARRLRPDPAPEPAGSDLL